MSTAVERKVQELEERIAQSEKRVAELADEFRVLLPRNSKKSRKSKN